MKALRVGVALLLVALLAAIAVVAYQSLSSPGLDRDALARDGVVLLPTPRAIPEITLLDQHQQPYRLSEPTEHWRLVFFGYTFCPDICPTTLADLRLLLGKLPEASRGRVQVVMVSVDPERDTPERLQQYLAFFDPQYIGLGGDLEAIQATSNALGVPFIPADTSRPNYTVDHSGNLAIVNPQGELHGFIRAPLQVERLAQGLPQLLDSAAAR